MIGAIRQENSWILEKDETGPIFSQNYFPESMDRSDRGSGIKGSLVENLFRNCGSGSWCEAAFQGVKENLVHHKVSGPWTVVIFPLSSQQELVHPVTVSEKLNNIRDAFGLSMAALADVLRASRASLYNWFDNEPRSEDIVRRIESIYDIAQSWRAENPFHFAPGKLMKQKLNGGPSMLERLSREELDANEIQNGLEQLLMLMRRQRDRMDRARVRSANAPADTESHGEVLERLTGSVSSEK